MDDKSIRTEADNTNDGQPLPDPEQIGTGRSMDDMMDYYAAIGYALCSPDETTDEEAEALGKFVQAIISREKIERPDIIAGERIKEILKRIEKLQDDIKTYRKDVELNISYNSMLEFYQSGMWKESRREISRVMMLAPLADEISKLAPYFEKEISKPEYGGKTIDDLLNEAELNADGEPLEGSLLYKALNAARTAMEKETGQLLNVSYNNSYKLKTATDKLFNDFFSLGIRDIDLDGQRQFLKYERSAPATTKKGKKQEAKQITLIYDIVQDSDFFQTTGIKKKFSYYDLFVAAILDNLYDEGNKVVSLTKIWHELGGSGRPGEKHIQKLTDSLQRGMSTIMTIDDIEVQRAWGNKRSKQIVSPVMPIQMANERYTANGKISDGVVHITGHTPFYMVAAPLKHITTWDKEVLKLYTGKRTDRYHNVLWYLLRNIGWMGSPKSNRSNKITYKDLYNHNGDKSTRDKQLTWNMVHTLLDDVFIPAGYVTAYKEEEKGKDPGIILTVKKRQNLIGGTGEE